MWWLHRDAGADYSSSASDSEEDPPQERATEELASLELEESWTSKGEEVEPDTSLSGLGKQELMRRHLLRKHVEKLESAVHKKEGLVKDLRLIYPLV